jgi:toxin YhaV
MQRHGWTLLFHTCVVEQLQKLRDAAERVQKNDPSGFESNANIKLLCALSQVMMDGVPTGPAREEYRQGNTLGHEHRHWRRAKIGRRFRLFFRYDSKANIIVFAWVNDEQTLRSSGSKSDPYAVFQKMLEQGNPPDDWDSLIKASQQDWNK